MGDVLRLKFQNNQIEFAASTGIGLQNRFGQNLLEFLFIGGDTNYVFNDAVISRPTGIPWTDQGLNLEFELTSPSAYRLTVNSLTVTGQLAVTSESVIDRFRTWNYSTGPVTGGEGYNVYLTDLSIDGVALESSTYQDEVTAVSYTHLTLPTNREV